MKPEELELILEKAKELAKALTPVLEAALHYQQMSYRTPDEDEEYQKLLDVAQQGKQAIEMLQTVAGDEAYRASVAYYYSVKQKADEGDPKAKEILAEMAPLYAEELLKQLDNN